MTLEGTITALVTPFGKDGKVDFGALRALVERQVAGGVEGIVPVGTSGESPTLSHEEHLKVIEETISAAAGRVKIIAGAGANATSEAVELTKAVIAMGGADATLQVMPYYNKPNAEGAYRHFSTIADLGLPIVLYNVPGRSGKEIPLDTVARLAVHPNVCAIKEAAGSVERVSQILDKCAITVLSGDDSLTLPMISVGARGVISVASNVIPREMGDFVRLALAGDLAAARTMHRKYYRLFKNLFIDSNPIPAKEALSAMGLVENVFRLPLCETSEENRATIRATLKECGII
ncbi:MAG: 4-hydroxy-tetrahydrodipicolinate synthase [Kiritimatiellae bacterium]|nr:4-hydroxy-tetrahydrodipicolinate synthase [Kiritimatiellia bacterium]